MLGIVTGESFAMLVLFNNMTNWDFLQYPKDRIVKLWEWCWSDLPFVIVSITVLNTCSLCADRFTRSLPELVAISPSAVCCEFWSELRFWLPLRHSFGCRQCYVAWGMCYWQALQPFSFPSAAANEHHDALDASRGSEQRTWRSHGEWRATRRGRRGSLQWRHGTHVLRWVGGIRHDEWWKWLMMMVMNFSYAMSKKVLYFRVNSKITRQEVRG